MAPGAIAFVFAKIGRFGNWYSHGRVNSRGQGGIIIRFSPRAKFFCCRCLSLLSPGAHTEREREREREREAQRFIYSLRLFLNAICTETVTNIYSDNNNKRGEIKPATRVITLGEIIAIKTKSRASRRRRRRIFFAITNNNTIRDRFPLLFFSLFFSFFLFFLFFFFPPFRAGRFVSLAPEVIAGVGVEGSIRGCLANRRINKTAECHRPAEEEKKKWISIHGAPRCVRTDER